MTFIRQERAPSACLDPRPRAYWLALVLVTVACGCTCERDDAAESKPSGTLEWSCGPDPSGQSASLRASGDHPASDDAPSVFAVELGRAAFGADELVVPHLDHDGKRQHARALLQQSSGRRVVDLGVVHGDVAPPEAAVSGRRVVFAVMDHDAGGESYRIGEASLEAGELEPLFTSDIVGGGDRSPSFDVAARADGALLVWDDWDSSEARGVVRAAWVTPGPGQPRLSALSPAPSDVEAPRVVASRAGYYVAWVALGEPRPAASGGGASEAEGSVVRVTRRWIQLIRLDAHGVQSAPPLDVTPRDGFVVGFDLAVGHGDLVRFAYREGSSTPGISGGAIGVATIDSGGGVQRHVVVSEDVGSGIPSLAFDPEPTPEAPHAWLAYAAADGDTRLLALLPDGHPKEMGRGPLELGEAAVLAARHGRLVVATPRGRDVEVSEMRCRPGERSTGPALPPQEITE